MSVALVALIIDVARGGGIDEVGLSVAITSVVTGIVWLLTVFRARESAIAPATVAAINPSLVEVKE